MVGVDASESANQLAVCWLAGPPSPLYTWRLYVLYTVVPYFPPTLSGSDFFHPGYRISAVLAVVL
jgi:hypothetical protein